MKHYCAAILSFLLCVPALHAQVEVSLRIEPTRAVLLEPVIATVRISNQTSQPITLRDDTPGTRLWMEIEQTPGRTIRQTSPDILRQPLVIPPRQTVTHRVNIGSVYDLRVTGPYTLRAGVDWSGRAYMSSKVFLDVVPGLEVTRMTGAVSPDGSDTRLYRLMSLNRDRAEHLFLRIDDESRNICYGVIPLGRILRVQQPRLELDAAGHVHILHQAGPGRFLHHQFTPSGERVRRRVFTSEEPGVALEHSPDGRVDVTGAATSMQEED